MESHGIEPDWPLGSLMAITDSSLVLKNYSVATGNGLHRPLLSVDMRCLFSDIPGAGGVRTRVWLEA